MSAVLIILMGGCGGGTEGKTFKLKKVNFRPVADSDPLLTKRFASVSGGYSIRPLSGCEKSAMPKSAAPALAKRPALFRDRVTGESMVIYAYGKNTVISSVSFLAGLRDGIVRGVGKTPGAKLIGTDIFSYKGRYFVQSLVQNGSWFNLQLSVFCRSGRSLQLDYRIQVDNYRIKSRAIEASIASLDIRE